APTRRAPGRRGCDRLRRGARGPHARAPHLPGSPRRSRRPRPGNVAPPTRRCRRDWLRVPGPAAPRRSPQHRPSSPPDATDGYRRPNVTFEPRACRHMKVLLVTMYFPPSGGGGVQRPLKLATHLPELGVETHVLAPDDPQWIHRDEQLPMPTL